MNPFHIRKPYSYTRLYETSPIGLLGRLALSLLLCFFSEDRDVGVLYLYTKFDFEWCILTTEIHHRAEKAGNTHIHTYKQTHKHTHIHTHTHMRVRAHTITHTHAYARIHTNKHTHTHTHTRID